MNNIIDRAKMAVEYAYPYIDDARDYASSAVYKTKCGIKKGKKRLKHKMFMVKLKNAVDIISNFVLIVAAVVAAITAILAYVNKLNDN